MVGLPTRRFATALLVTALIATACSNDEPVALPATPTPAPVVEATPVPPTATALPPTSTPVPPTPEPTAVPTVEEALLPPTPTASDVFFRPVTPGVGPFDYPPVGLDLFANDTEAEALWTVIELNNAVVKIDETGSIENIPSWDALKARELVSERMVASIEGIAELDDRAVTGADSAITEVTITRLEGELRIKICYQGTFVITDQQGIAEQRTHTTTREFQFFRSGPTWQHVGTERLPVDLERMVPCNLV